LVLKVCREFDDVTSAGELFHVRAAATGNARSPTVDSRVDPWGSPVVREPPPWISAVNRGYGRCIAKKAITNFQGEIKL